MTQLNESLKNSFDDSQKKLQAPVDPSYEYHATQLPQHQSDVQFSPRSRGRTHALLVAQQMQRNSSVPRQQQPLIPKIEKILDSEKSYQQENEIKGPLPVEIRPKGEFEDSSHQHQPRYELKSNIRTNKINATHKTNTFHRKSLLHQNGRNLHVSRKNKFQFRSNLNISQVKSVVAPTPRLASAPAPAPHPPVVENAANCATSGTRKTCGCKNKQ